MAGFCASWFVTVCLVCVCVACVCVCVGQLPGFQLFFFVATCVWQVLFFLTFERDFDVNFDFTFTYSVALTNTISEPLRSRFEFDGARTCARRARARRVPRARGTRGTVLSRHSAQI